MHNIAKHAIILLLAVTLILCPFATATIAGDQVVREDISGEAMAADTVLLRPLGLVSTVLGSALFVVSLPFSLLGGNTGDAAQKLVVDPAKYTFNRPLGDF
jgi:hypothetical protein